MVQQYLQPKAVLDVGAAYGFVVGQLGALGVRASGFDISPYAVSQKGRYDIWVGSADDPAAYRQTDLILATELAECLTPEQATTFLTVARNFGQRMLLLICIDLDPDADGRKTAIDPNDQSHINVRPMWWWRNLAVEAGWKLGDAVRFNEDRRSETMSWAGRFLLLER